MVCYTPQRRNVSSKPLLLKHSGIRSFDSALTTPQELELRCLQVSPEEARILEVLEYAEDAITAEIRMKIERAEKLATSKVAKLQLEHRNSAKRC